MSLKPSEIIEADVIAGGNMRRHFDKQMDMVTQEPPVNDGHAPFITDMADDLAHPKTHVAMQHPEPIFRCPVIAVMKNRVWSACTGLVRQTNGSSLLKAGGPTPYMKH